MYSLVCLYLPRSCARSHKILGFDKNCFLFDFFVRLFITLLLTCYTDPCAILLLLTFLCAFIFSVDVALPLLVIVFKLDDLMIFFCSFFEH